MSHPVHRPRRRRASWGRQRALRRGRETLHTTIGHNTIDPPAVGGGARGRGGCCETDGRQAVFQFVILKINKFWYLRAAPLHAAGWEGIECTSRGATILVLWSRRPDLSAPCLSSPLPALRCRSLFTTGWRAARAWNMELGSWNLELGTWKLERGTWNVELGTWNVERGTFELRKYKGGSIAGSGDRLRAGREGEGGALGGARTWSNVTRTGRPAPLSAPIAHVAFRLARHSWTLAGSRGLCTEFAAWENGRGRCAPIGLGRNGRRRVR